MTMIVGGTAIKALTIIVTNASTRPVIPTQLDGELKLSFGEWIKKKIFKKSINNGISFLTEPSIDHEIRPGGAWKTLEEGHFIQIAIPWTPKGKQIAEKFAELKNLYVFDSVRRKHFVSCSNLRKFRKDIINF